MLIITDVMKLKNHGREILSIAYHDVLYVSTLIYKEEIE